MSVVKIGFIGCGGIANGKHLPGMSGRENVKLVAFCDIVKERAEKACKEYGTEDAKVYTDYKELLKDESIDAVHVLTPNVLHSEITVAALEAGKHVMCEKPMAATTEDAEKMIEARDKSGKMLTIGYQYRHFTHNKTTKRVIEDGLIGEPYYAEASYIRRRGVPTWGVFTDKEKQGGGPLIDIGTHALDLTLWLINNYEVDYVVGTTFEKLGTLLEPDEQGQYRKGMLNSWNNKTYDVEDSAVGHIKMKNGAVIHLRATWAINLPDDIATDSASALIAGTKGGVDTLGEVCRLNHVVASQQATTIIGQKTPAYIPGFSVGPNPRTEEADIWANALTNGGDLFVTADQAFVVTKILDSIYKSAKTGKPVYFD